jgi:hypothetical protein
MSLRTINITIPADELVPDIINTFTPEENMLMLKIGSNCLKEGRQAVAGLTQKELYNKIKDETKDEIQKLETNLLVERELRSVISEEMSKMYKKQIDDMKTQIKDMSHTISKYELANVELVNKATEKAKEKYDLLLQEKDKQVSKFSDTYEKLLVQSHKSTSHKGSDGEKQFEDYANTFIDFKGFELIDKHTQGGDGDFHMRFEEFDVLVDAKNYKKKVPIDQREKIKNDLIKNEHIPFAWLVSLNTTIDKFDKSIIMYEWINTRQCIIYINNLAQNDDPKKILRMVWFTCKELYRFISDVSVDDDELTTIKETHFKLMDKVKNLRKNIREINTTINVTKNMIQVMDDQLKEILESETTTIVESNYSFFDDWWTKNIEVSNEDVRLVSTDIWFKFKSDNKIELNEFNITPDKFKQFIKSKTPSINIFLKNKSANSAFEIKGIKFKNTKKDNITKVFGKMLPSEENIVLNLNENLLAKNTVSKKKNNSSVEEYFNEEQIDKIISEYSVEENDIMNIALINNIKPCEVISLLVRHKIIVKRDQAKGYDKYKETDEYKNKLTIKK